MVKERNIVKDYKQILCPLCINSDSCPKDKLIPEHDAQSKMITLKCEEYRRANNEQE